MSPCRKLKIFGAVGVAVLFLTGCYPSFHGRAVVPDSSNYWNQADKTIHVAPNQSERVLWHEWCHGWQGETLELEDTGLEGWKSTPAGLAFDGSLEQAADVCAATCLGEWIDTQYDYIDEIKPSWIAWAERWVTCPSD